LVININLKCLCLSHRSWVLQPWNCQVQCYLIITITFWENIVKIDFIIIFNLTSEISICKPSKVIVIAIISNLWFITNWNITWYLYYYEAGFLYVPWKLKWELILNSILTSQVWRWRHRSWCDWNWLSCLCEGRAFIDWVYIL